MVKLDEAASAILPVLPDCVVLTCSPLPPPDIVVQLSVPDPLVVKACPTVPSVEGSVHVTLETIDAGA